MMGWDVHLSALFITITEASHFSNMLPTGDFWVDNNICYTNGIDIGAPVAQVVGKVLLNTVELVELSS